MTRQTTGLGQVLFSGMLILAAVVAAGCGARSSDRDAELSLQYIQAMDDALARGDENAAEMARQAAYLAALGSLRWEAMADVGDAFVRFTQSTGVEPALRPEARQAYLVALYRARRQGVLEGVLRVSETLAALGDREDARVGLSMAASMAEVGHGNDDVARVQAALNRVEDHDGVSDGSAAAEIQGPAHATWTR
jgi:hypothetical protein